MKNKPAYWYEQSAAIPFRINEKGTEILIITTRKKKKWIFPKGIVEVGLSSRDSAVKEALEEAGVKGNLIEENLGSYSYKKWGAECNVKVYGLDVEIYLNDWEENFRERKWIGINEVQNYILDRKLLTSLNNLKLALKLN
jgi:phosphohistidine phosphatase